jgi:hypothetical protein
MIDMNDPSGRITLPTIPKVRINNLPKEASTPAQGGVWTGYGPPVDTLGAVAGDGYVDLLTWDLYTLTGA